MSNFTDGLRNAWKIDELRQRIGFTALMLVIARIGAHLPVPAITGTTEAKGAFGMFDLFVGGAYGNGAIFALGIMPYISASIIVQLAGAIVPYFQKLQQEGEQGRRLLTAYTRYITVALAFAQGLAVALSLQSTDNGAGMPMVLPSMQGPAFVMMAAVIFTAGTMFLMWVGEQITEKGIGNGVSLLIFIGIVARFPGAIWGELSNIGTGAGQRNIIIELLMVVGFLAIIGLVVLFTQAQRRVPVQYAKRVVGNRGPASTTSHIPISLITANVMPIIFASTILLVPSLLTQLAPTSGAARFVAQNFSQGSPLFETVFAVMIIFFTFFYTAIVFSPRDVAENMRKNGGYIPGVRPGRDTEEYLDRILFRVTVPGALFLALIAVLPSFMRGLGVTSGFADFFGGTSLLIMVGVALDTLKQIEAYLLMRHYDGFMKSGKLRGRTAQQTIGSN